MEIESVDTDGSIAVSADDRGRVTLPPDYVSESVTLGYASTAMAGQSRTVDHSLVLVDGPIDAAGLYVPMTRGRDGNDVWVVTDPDSQADAVDLLAEGHAATLDRRAGADHLAGIVESVGGDGIDL